MELKEKKKYDYDYEKHIGFNMSYNLFDKMKIGMRRDRRNIGNFITVAIEKYLEDSGIKLNE